MLYGKPYGVPYAVPYGAWAGLRGLRRSRGLVKLGVFRSRGVQEVRGVERLRELRGGES